MVWWIDKSQMNHDYSSGTKKGNPLFDFLFGFFLFFAAMPILWYNERRYYDGLNIFI